LTLGIAPVRRWRVDDRYFEKYQYNIGPSKKHEEAMDHIYDRADFDGEDDEYTECEKCSKQIQNFENPVFVVGIYVDNIRQDQELWCGKCVLEVINAKQD
jgi:hypothetical protein